MSDLTQTWARLPVAIDDLVREGQARAAFLLDSGAELLHARGDFATQVIYPPSPEALSAGWAFVRTGSGDLLVFVTVDGGALLGAVFPDTDSEHLARQLLERTVVAASRLH